MIKNLICSFLLAATLLFIAAFTLTCCEQQGASTGNNSLGFSSVKFIEKLVTDTVFVEKDWEKYDESKAVLTRFMLTPQDKSYIKTLKNISNYNSDTKYHDIDMRLINSISFLQPEVDISSDSILIDIIVKSKLN